MEALGVASSIAGLISLADVIAFKVSKYYTLVKGAQSDIKALLIEVQSLYGVLNSLKLLATCLEDGQQQLGPAKIPQLDHFQTCRQNLDYLKKSLSKLDLDSSSKLTVVKVKLLWPFKATETKELVERIARNKRDLADALTAEGLTSLINALSTHTNLTEAVEDVQMKLRKMAEEKGENEQDERKKTVFEWCSVVTPYEKHRSAKSLRHPNTVLWFFESPEFKRWTEESNSSIWLFGIPGAGKTILTSAVIEEAKMVTATKPDHAIAYFYIEYRLPETQILSNILGSLIRQICASSEEAFEELESFYRECNEKSKHPVLPTCEQLGELLSRISRCFECVMVVIDGLDESADPHERSSTLELLSNLSLPENGTIKVVYTSRDEIDIRQTFSAFEGISIAARSNDLELYVAAVIELRIKSKSLRLRDPALKEIIINGIVSKANGMFQWAKCQLDHLCLLSTDKERRRALEILPTDLFETYTRILNRVANSTPGNKRLVERTLRWIVYAKHLMHIDTIATAVAVEIGSNSMDEDDIPDQDSILKWCSSLVTKNEHTGVLALSHFTVKEFLEDEKLLAIPGLRDFYMSSKSSEKIIGSVCLTYLQFPEFWHWDLRSKETVSSRAGQENDLLRYSCAWWLGHARDGEDEDEREDKVYTDLTRQLFNPEKSSNFVLWLHLYWAEHEYRDVPKAAPTLHVAAGLGLVNVCSWLLEDDCDVDFDDAILGTPLVCAIKGISFRNYHTSKVEIVRMLLAKGADGGVNFGETDSLDSRDDHRLQTKHILTPMSLTLDLVSSSAECCCLIFRELLNSHNISSIVDSSIWSGFLILPPPPPPPRTITKVETKGPDRNIERENPRQMIVGLFREALNHPDSILFDSDSRIKMISYIAEHGKEPSDKDLVSKLATREDLNDSPRTTSDSAVLAAGNGQTHLIKAFVEKGVDPKLLYDCIPAAAESGHRDMVALLLDYCPQNNSKIIEIVYLSWIIAAKEGWTEILDEFIKHGIDINVEVRQTDDRNLVLREGAAIAYAIMFGHLEAVELLINIPELDLGALTGGCNLVHLALRSRMFRSEILNLVLGKGVSPLQDQTVGDEQSTLHFLLGCENSLSQRDVHILKRLIDCGCDTKKTDKQGNSLLHAVLKRRTIPTHSWFEDIILLLNADGELKTKRDKAGELPLQSAVRARAPSSIIRMLIPKDLALWNSPDVCVFSVLHSAVCPDRVVPKQVGSGPPRLPGLLPPVIKASSTIGTRGPPPLPPPPSGFLQPRNTLPRSSYDDNRMSRILDVLLETENINVNVVDELGNTPLSVTVNYCNETSSVVRAQIIKKLLAKGADVNRANATRWTPLHHLASLGFAAGIREIFKSNPDLEALNENGYSALHQAIFQNKTGCVRMWIDQANSSNPKSESFVKALETRTSRGLLPLHVAALYNRVEIILLFHDTGRLADINAPGLIDQVTPLHLAAVANHVASMGILIQYGADLSAKATFGNTPLHFAAERGNVPAAKLLIEHGALAGVDNDDGLKPWMMAEKHKHNDLKFALEMAAKHEEQVKNSEGCNELVLVGNSVNTTDDGMQEPNFAMLFHMPPPSIKPTTLLEAVNSGEELECRALLATGSNPNMVVGKFEETPLHVACHRGIASVVKLLIDYGAAIDAEDESQNQPLHCAASEGRLDVAEMLVENGASLTARNKDMQTPLHLAAENGHLDVVKMLLKTSRCVVVTIGETGEVIDTTSSNGLGIAAGMSPYIELRDKEGYTPLIASVYGEHVDVAKYLISEGANVHAVDLCGCGAIWHAGDGGKDSNKEFFESLISQGVDINQRSPGGYTAIDNLAARMKNFEEITALALYLIECGAIITPKSHYRHFPLLFAAGAGNVSLVKELMKRMTMEEITTQSETLGTPLYNAAFHGKAEVVKIMLEAGVDVGIPFRGETPLEAAAKEGHWDAVEIIKAHLYPEERKEMEGKGGKEDGGSKSTKGELALRPRIEELDDELITSEEASTSAGETLPP